MLATGTAILADALQTASAGRARSAGRAAALIQAALLAWLAGIALQLRQAQLPENGVPEAALSVGLALLLTAALLHRMVRAGEQSTLRSVGTRAAAGPLVLVGVALMGWGHANQLATERVGQWLLPELEQQDMVVTGVVAKLPQLAANAVRFDFRVERATLRGVAVPVPPRLSIGWYAGWGDAATLSATQRSLRAGERWRLTLRLRRPHGNLNPHGFDHELNLFERGIGATGYVRDGPDAPRLLGSAVAHPVERLRQGVRDSIRETVDNPRAAGVLAALAVGDQSAIDREDWQIFRDSGIAHLVAISGLHVTMFAWLAAALIGCAWRRCGSVSLQVPAPLVARCGGVAAAAGYALLAGWGVPAQRTVLMLATVVLLGSIGRRWPWPMVLSLSAAVVTCFDPWALLQPGFWLSFVAVGLLFAAAPQSRTPAAPVASGDDRPSAGGLLKAWLQRAVSWLLQLLHSQALITLGLAPLTLIFFQQISLVGMAANLIAIPLVTLVITPLALLGIVLPILWLPAAAVIQGMIDLLAMCTDWPWAVWTIAAAPAWAQLAGLLGAAVAALPLPWSLRALAIPLAMPMLFPGRELPPPGRFEMVVVDVGQGTAVLVRTHRRVLLFDTGPRYGPDSDAAGRALIPLLRGRGERRIDRLILSHRDGDHVGGARTLLATVPVTDWWGSLDDDHPLRQGGVPNSLCTAGERWTWDGVDFDILHPLPDADLRQPRANGLSCVLRIVARGQGGGSALLTGDIGRPEELAIVARSYGDLQSTLLLVPHHGSRSSSSDELLAAVNPRIAVVQAGYRNRFGHPAPVVVGRYGSHRIPLVSTVQCGAWSWRGDAQGRDAACQRELGRRYWHHPGNPDQAER